MNIFTDDKGFFQRGKAFGGKGLGGMLKGLKKKPYAGVPGVCPYTGKPLQTPTEEASGVSDDISQMATSGMAGGMSMPEQQQEEIPALTDNPYRQRRRQGFGGGLYGQ